MRKTFSAGKKIAFYEKLKVDVLKTVRAFQPFLEQIVGNKKRITINAIITLIRDPFRSKLYDAVHRLHLAITAESPLSCGH